MSILRSILGDMVQSRAGAPADAAAKLYVDLLKRCVSNAIYDDDRDLMRGAKALDPATGKFFVEHPEAADSESKYYGTMWPSRAHTMIGMPRLDNLQMCVEGVLADRIPGDLIETGVWRGGAAIFMRGILKAYGVTDRIVWAADSFEGIPPADLARYPKESTGNFHLARDLAVSLEEVQRNFERYGLLDDQVRFLKGWFRDTLPSAPVEKLAILRLDGDLYESTMDALKALYPKLSPGGYVIIDDYNAFQCCNEAVADYQREHGITTPVTVISPKGGYWRKA